MLKMPRSPASPPTYAMCFHPATLGVIATIATVGSAAISAVGAIQQGQAAKAQGDLQAQVLQQQAASKRQVAAANEEDFRSRQSRVLAARRAALGGSGTDPSSGSPLLVSQDFAGETELQALRIRTGGEVRATRAEQQAQLQRFQGRTARTAGFIRGGSLLVGGIGTAAARKAFG